MELKSRRTAQIVAPLVAAAAVLGGAALLRHPSFVALEIPSWLIPAVASGIGLGTWRALLWAFGRWQATHVDGVTQVLSGLGGSPPPPVAQPIDEDLHILGQRWLGAGSVGLLAGPRALPLRRCVAELVRSGVDVWVVGAAIRVREPFEGPGSVRYAVDPVSDELMVAWSEEVLARGRRPLLLVLPQDGLADRRLAERIESRMGRLVRSLASPRAKGLRVLFFWQTDPDRVLVPDPVGKRGLEGVDTLRMWNQRRALVPVDPPGLPVITALARWLVSPAASLAWNRPNQKTAAAAAALGSGLVYGLGSLLVCSAAFLGEAREQRLIGDSGESLVGSLWSNWWVSEAIRQGRPLDLFSSDLIFWPQGGSLISLFGNVLPNLLAQPFQLLMGYPGYWNVFVLLSMVVNGLAMRALARRLGADRSGAFLAGLVFALSPALVAQVSAGHQNAFQAFGLPLALWAGLGVMDSRDRRGEFVTAAALMVACLGWWLYGALAWALLLVFGASRWWHASPERRSELVGMLGRVVRFWLPTLLFAGPLLAEANSQKLAGMWFGSFPHELEGDMLADTLIRNMVDSSLRPASLLLGDPGERLGWVPALLGAGVLITWSASPYRSQRFWPVLGGLLLVAAMGPYLQASASGVDDWTPLPGVLLFYGLPGWSRLHDPSRLLIPVALCLAVMVALLWPWVLRLSWRRGSVVPLSLASTVVVALPFTAGESPVAVTTFDPPAYYSVFNEQGAMVELPMGYREETLLYQPYHGLARVGGPGESWRASQPNGAFHLQLRLDPILSFLSDPGGRPPQAEALLIAREQGLQYVVVHGGWLRQLAMVKLDQRVMAVMEHMDRVDSLLGPPIYKSAHVTIYRLPGDELEAQEKVVAFREADSNQGGGGFGGGNAQGGAVGGIESGVVAPGDLIRGLTEGGTVNQQGAEASGGASSPGGGSPGGGAQLPQ